MTQPDILLKQRVRKSFPANGALACGRDSGTDPSVKIGRTSHRQKAAARESRCGYLVLATHEIPTGGQPHPPVISVHSRGLRAAARTRGWAVRRPCPRHDLVSSSTTSSTISGDNPENTTATDIFTLHTGTSCRQRHHGTTERATEPKKLQSSGEFGTI